MKHKKQHILVLPINYPSDVNPIAGTFFKEQVKAIASAGYKVGVLSFNALPLKKWSQCHSKIENSKGIIIDQTCFPSLPKLISVNHKIRTYFVKKKIKRYINKNGHPDLIHVHVHSSAEAAIWAKQRFGIPYVITEHYSHFANNQLNSYQLKFAKRAFQFANERLCVSQSLGNTLTELFQLSFKCIPNILDPRFKLDNKLISSTPYLLSVGSLSKVKNHQLLLKAFSRISQERPELNLIIAGEGPLKKDLISLSHELGISKRVKFVGNKTKSELTKLMSGAIRFCLPSNYETFGVVLIESMACGTPVIATNVGGIPEIVDSSELGILCKSDFKSFSDAILKSLDISYDNNKIAETTINKYGKVSFLEKITAVYSGLKS